VSSYYVETFTSAAEYQDWVQYREDIQILDITVFGQLVVTYTYKR
jgi:hypothetical protein